ncbi:uncharacterized protein [Muntiacus reevesi]|uniref:uncharacterized protein n=1 Tax=Muntiacus reevesi TaxID=9886 RepID=UPI003306B9A5
MTHVSVTVATPRSTPPLTPLPMLPSSDVSRSPGADKRPSPPPLGLERVRRRERLQVRVRRRERPQASGRRHRDARAPGPLLRGGKVETGSVPTAKGPGPGSSADTSMTITECNSPVCWPRPVSRKVVAAVVSGSPLGTRECPGFWRESWLEASEAGEGHCDPRAAAAGAAVAAAVAAVAEKAAGASSSCGGAHCRRLPGEKSFSAGCLKVAHAAAPSRTSVTLGSRVGGLHPAPLLLASRAAGCSADLGQRAPWPGGQAAREAGRLQQCRLSRWRGFGRKASSETPGLSH